MAKKTVKPSITDDAPDEADVMFIRRVNAFMQTAPDDIRDFLHFLYAVSREFDFVVDNELALIPFQCDDNTIRWAVFTSTSVAKITPAEKRRATIEAKKRGLQTKPNTTLAMDLTPISMGLSSDPLEAIRQSRMFMSSVMGEVN